MKKMVGVKSKAKIPPSAKEENADSVAENDVSEEDEDVSEEDEDVSEEDEDVAEDDDDVPEEEDDVAEEEDALDASATESDSAGSDSEGDGDEEKNAESAESKKLTLTAIESELLQKYRERQGKQLYIRFPEKLPEDENGFQQKVKTLSPLVVKGNKPRQRHARFCIVDFNSKEDRDTALQAIESAASTEKAFKGIVAKIPHTESTDFLKELAERKLRTIENKKAKQRLKRSARAALQRKNRNFSPTIVVLNLPQNCSLAEVRKLFPSAVDIRLKPEKGKLSNGCLAAVTMPSSIDARSAAKQKLSLGGNQLKIKFINHQKKKKSPKATKPTKRKWEGKDKKEHEIKSKKSKT